MRSTGKQHDPPNCVGYCLECEYGEMSHDATGQEVAMFGVLDWAEAERRFQERPGADVYFDKSFPNRVVWYLAQGLYKMYYTSVDKTKTDIGKCEEVFQAQGNNPDGQKEVSNERSLSMSDIVVLQDHTVWLCDNGWTCINPGVIR